MSRLFLALMVGCGLACGGAARAATPEVIHYLQARAQAFVLEKLDLPPDAQAQVQAAAIDDRLILSRCEEGLSLSLPARMAIRRNTTVYLECEGAEPWDLYLPVRVSIQKPYVTVAAPVARGELLSDSMLILAYEDQSLLRGDHLADPAPLIGARTKRELKPGQPVRLAQICVVCKGDEVTLSAGNSSMQIKTMARALQDGSIGEMIRLINVRSGKPVQGKVSAVGSVVITF